MNSLPLKICVAAAFLNLGACATSHNPNAALSLQEIEKASLESVIYVGTDSGHGSGFSISKHCVMTAAHVVSGVEKTISFYGQDRTNYYAKVLIEKFDLDIAVVCSESANMRPAKLAKQMPDTFDTVFVIGHPLRLLNIMTEGKYQGDGITITAQVAPGNSGGPVFNNSGEVIGIAVAVATVPTSGGIMVFPYLARIVPIGDIKKVLSELNGNDL